MNPFDLFIPILINPLVNVLLVFYKLAETLGLPGPLGWSIIFMTIAVRLLVYPLYATQLRNQMKMSALKPHLDEVKRKHGHDRARHAEEQMKLYRQHGVSPAGGCLPLLIQTFILLGLFYALSPILSGSAEAALNHLNQVAYSPSLHLAHFDENFLGFNLATSPSKIGPSLELLGQKFNVGLLWVPVLTGLLQFVLSKMMQQPTAPDPKKKEEPSFQDALMQSQSSMMFIFPLLIASASYSFPLGLTLYWNVTNIFAIIQQYLIAGPGGLAKWLPKQPTPSK
jgi:YidC/Oxa1 family membrane protein insertase